jgi:hypothetical protein
LEAEEAEETIHTSGQYAGGKKPVSVPKKVAVLPLSDVPIYPNGTQRSKTLNNLIYFAKFMFRRHQSIEL